MLAALLALPFAAQLIVYADPDQSRFARPADQQQTREMRFRGMDRNNDGVVTRAEWRGSDESFRVHDWNGDGILSGDEVRSGALRPLNTSPQDEDIWEDREDTFDNLDVNRNNQIERDEWHASADAFQWLDRNKDGVLSRREVVGSGRRNAQAGTVGTSGRQDCVDNPQRIVDLVYQQVLERRADQASAGMPQELASGRLTVRDLVAQLAKSEEHATRYFWQPVVTTVYRQMLNRDPNPQELSDASSQLAGGQRQLADLLGRTARRATNSEEEAVKLLYRRLLGREADEAGLRDFTAMGQRQGMEAVAREIINSREYRQRAGSSTAAQDVEAYEAAVRTLYRHVLGRDPDPNGLRDLTRVAMTSGFDAVVDQMVRSPEYERLYANDTVPGRNVRYCGTTF